MEPQEDGHSFGERPLVAGKEHPQAFVVAVVNEKQVWGQVAFLQTSVQQAQ